MMKRESHNYESRDRTLHRWLIAFLSLGIAWRIIRYALGMPIWGDEAYIGLNIINRTYAGLLKPLDFVQVAPIVFLWSQRAVYHMLGMSEYAMRLLPALAGLAALGLFHRWAACLAKPLPATLATAIVAVGYYIVHLSTEFKPYSFDFLAALLLLLPAATFLKHRRVRDLVILLIVLPLTVAMSYPAVFVAGGVAIAILTTFPSQSRACRILSTAYCLILVATFYLLMTRIGQRQYDHTSDYMVDYWADAFPPANPLKFSIWIVNVHVGRFFAYPVGGKHGLSLLNFIFALVGVKALWRQTDLPVKMLLFSPFLLTFFAAALRRYPYGEDARVSQHLAPSICLLIAAGIAAAIDRLGTQPQRHRQAVSAAFVVLLVVGLCGLTGNLLWPYHNQSASEVRVAVRDLFNRAQPGDAIVVATPPSKVPVNLLWYLREQEARLIWSEPVNASAAPWRGSPGGIWVVNCVESQSASLPQSLEGLFGRPITGEMTEHFEVIPHREWPPGIWQVMHFLPPRPGTQYAGRPPETPIRGRVN